MIVGFLALRFPVKIMCYVLLIFHFVHCGCDRGLIASAKVIVEVIMYLTIVELVRSRESQEYINLYRNFYMVSEPWRPRSYGSEVRT
jgi:hypothetical protein